MDGYVIGQVSRKAEVRMAGNKEVLGFSVKCEREGSGRTFTTYVGVTCYGNDAKQWAGRLSEGALVCVTGGQFSARTYESKGEHKAALNYTSFTSNIKLLSGGSAAPAPSARPATAVASDADEVPF